MKKRMILAVMCILLLTVLAGCSSVDPIADVKRISFPEDLGNDATVDEMVNLVLKDVEWSSTKLYDDVYSDQVQGTIEEDIPDYRKFGDEICVMAFTVSYSGSVYHVEVDPYSSYWPASSSYPALNHVNAMYKISMGITPKNLIWDDNKDTTNPKLPIYSM